MPTQHIHDAFWNLTDLKSIRCCELTTSFVLSGKPLCIQYCHFPMDALKLTTNSHTTRVLLCSSEDLDHVGWDLVDLVGKHIPRFQWLGWSCLWVVLSLPQASIYFTVYIWQFLGIKYTDYFPSQGHNSRQLRSFWNTILLSFRMLHSKSPKVRMTRQWNHGEMEGDSIEHPLCLVQAQQSVWRVSIWLEPSRRIK